MAKAKLKKTVEGAFMTVEVLETGDKLIMNTDRLSEDIRNQLTLRGLDNRVTSAAVGKEGEAVFTAMEAVWEALVAGKMSARRSSTKKIDTVQLLEHLNNLDPEEAETARATLSSLGIEL